MVEPEPGKGLPWSQRQAPDVKAGVERCGAVWGVVRAAAREGSRFFAVAEGTDLQSDQRAYQEQ